MRILFIPWFYAKPKHINKYLNLYEKHGINHDIIHYQPKDALFYSGHHKMYNKFKEAKKEYDMIHCVSGGSLVLYNLIKGGWQTNKIIFDSCPMFPTLDCTTNYIHKYNNKYNFSEEMIKKTVKTIWNFDDIINSNSKNYKSEMLKNYNKVIFDKSRKMLILTDPDDKLVQYDKIEDLKIPTEYFYKSKHAQHIIFHEKKYNNEIEKFLNL